MSSYAANGPPKVPSGRPTLPYAQINPHLALPDNVKHLSVKYQVITRDGQEIIVGRVKIQTPKGGHAFVLRRFDTGAISQTTMFRAAFPTASEELEKIEANWVKQNFDSGRANGGSGRGDTLRLAGVWVHPEVAQILAPEYSLENIVESLINAQPEPGQEYRRSSKPASSGAHANGAIAASSSPVKPPSSSQPNIPLVAPSSPPPDSPKPTKRRKETSPAPGISTSPKKANLPLPTSTPRRSGRTTSPAPVPVPVPSTPLASQPVTRITRTKVTKTTTAKVVAVKPEQEEEREEAQAEAEDEYQNEGELGEDDVPDVPGPNMSEDIAEQKDLIAKLKAERDQKAPAEGPSAVPLSHSDSQGSSKRSRDEEEEENEAERKKSLKFNFREPGEENAVAKREIRSNRRISLDLEPQQKSAAWGALWFAAGLAAAATIPSFFMG